MAHGIQGRLVVMVGADFVAEHDRSCRCAATPTDKAVFLVTEICVHTSHRTVPAARSRSTYSLQHMSTSG